MQVITNSAQERKQLADFCFKFGWTLSVVSVSLRCAMPETLLWRLGRVVYEIKEKSK